MLNVEWESRRTPHLPFNIKHSTFPVSPRNSVPAIAVASHSGGEWGLVAPAVFKTVVSARKRRKVGSIPTRLRHLECGGRATALGERRHGRRSPDHFGASVKNPTLCAPASCAASIASTAASND